MQSVVKGNGMVHLPLPTTEEGNNSHHKKGLNGVNESMASRLAALTKALKDKIPHKNGVIGTSLKPREMKTEAKPTSLNGVTFPINNHFTPSKESSSEFVAKHCTGLLKKTTSHLSTSQSTIEKRVTKSLHLLRHRQLTMSHSHSARQIDSQQTSSDSFTTRSHRINMSNEATPPSGSPDTSIASNRSSTDVGLSSPPCLPDSSSQENTSLSSFSLQKHLQGLENFVDDEATCSSSDEEEDDLLLRRKRFKQPRSNTVKRRWEKDRAHIGSQWMWLCHQITSVNQKIFQLDSLLQSTHPKESVQFVQHNPFSTSCNIYNSQQNEATQSVIPSKLLLLLMEESTQTCARTRVLRHAPTRKLLRFKKKDGQNEDLHKSNDPAHHVFLSQPTDLSSSLWLDKAVYQILQEHSYASFPVQKRRKIASPAAIIDPTLSHISSSLRLERSKSFSPSPTPLDISIERIGKGIPRKRNSTSAHQSYSDDSHATTPTLPRKRKSTSTPQYDINNIIIPYSMASSTRLEKLEYKEILTPKWQEKSYASAKENGVKEEEIESIDDAIFQERHAKCEDKEKRRYLNFIGGNGNAHTRKRLRPKRSSTPEPSNLQHSSSTLTSDHDNEMFLQVLPFPPRRFPLVAKELAALEKPGPPPKKIAKYVPVSDCYSSSSPSPLASGDKCQTPLGRCPSPLSSPLTRVLTPPDNESPLSTSKWTVVNGTTHGISGGSGLSSFSTHQSSGLVLKLSKRS